MSHIIMMSDCVSYHNNYVDKCTSSVLMLQLIRLLITASAYSTIVYLRMFYYVADNSTTGGSGNTTMATMGNINLTMCCQIFFGIQACYEQCINVSMFYSLGL